MTERVTTEQAREVAASKLKHLSMVSQCALAADLLDARDEIERLKAQLDEILGTHNRIVSEQCAPDEKHCTCVPALRATLKRCHELLCEGSAWIGPDMERRPWTPLPTDASEREAVLSAIRLFGSLCWSYHKESDGYKAALAQVERHVDAALQARSFRDGAGVTEGELAKAMHAERLEREGCRSNYADERWDESKADRERWYATARVALRMMGGEK